jgi:hypothetical protein
MLITLLFIKEASVICSGIHWRQRGQQSRGSSKKQLQPTVPESLRWLFLDTQGGEKDNNTNVYYHYKMEASEYITQLAHIGIRSTCCRMCLFSFLSYLSHCVHLFFLPLQKSSLRTILFRVDELEELLQLLVPTGTAPTMTVTGRISATVTVKKKKKTMPES